MPPPFEKGDSVWYFPQGHGFITATFDPFAMFLGLSELPDNVTPKAAFLAGHSCPIVFYLICSLGPFFSKGFPLFLRVAGTLKTLQQLPSEVVQGRA